MKYIFFLIASMAFQAGVYIPILVDPKTKKVWCQFLSWFLFFSFGVFLVLSALVAKPVWKEWLIVTIVNCIIGFIITVLAFRKRYKNEQK